MVAAPLTNAQLAELMARQAEDEDPRSNRTRALQRASRAAYHWPSEASALLADGHSLTELSSVGPWLARVLEEWLESDDPPEPAEPPQVRRGYLTLAGVRVTLASDPSWAEGLRADLQMHTTWSDGKASLPQMAAEAASLGYPHVAVTDHSQGLKIAGGMDEDGFARQAVEIARVNRELERSNERLRILQGIEMNLDIRGQGDIDPAALARLDLVLGAFHSNLRLMEDQTDRYLSAVRNPTVHVLAHPRTRIFGRRTGLNADWPLVFGEAAALGTAVEVDGHPNRQDLDVQTLEIAREAGVWVSIGTDAHSTAELGAMGFGLAIAMRARFPKERILNFLPRDELMAWAGRR